MSEKGIRIPVFRGDRSVEMYEKDVDLWQKITKVEKKDQALHLVNVLDDDMRKIVMENCQTADLYKEGGVKIYLDYLKGTYGKDDLMDGLERYNEFCECRREIGQSINDFINDFSSSMQCFKTV